MSEKTHPIELGECPFCHGKATVTLKKEPYGYITGEWSVTYRYDGQPECENGCPIGQLNLPTYREAGVPIDHKPTLEEVETWFRRRWADDCAMLRRREPCSHCGGKPKFDTDKDGNIRFGCAHCKRWVQWDVLVMTVREWTERESKANRRLRKSDQLSDLLNGQEN